MDGPNDKIHIGPIWDCDLTYGIPTDYSTEEPLPIKNYDYPDNGEYSVLFYRLLKINAFNEKVKEVWNQTGKESYEKEIKILDKKIERLMKSGTYNNEKWNLIRFDTSTMVLKEWINERYEFFNQYMEE